MNASRRLLRLWDAAPRSPTPPEPFPLHAPQDVLRLLEEQIGAVRADPGASTTSKARTLGRLAALALKAIEVGQLAVRLEMLEAVLNQRDAGEKR